MSRTSSILASLALLAGTTLAANAQKIDEHGIMLRSQDKLVASK
jgi:hypothetical protein